MNTTHRMFSDAQMRAATRGMDGRSTIGAYAARAQMERLAAYEVRRAAALKQMSDEIDHADEYAAYAEEVARFEARHAAYMERIANCTKCNGTGVVEGPPPAWGYNEYFTISCSCRHSEWCECPECAA